MFKKIIAIFLASILLVGVSTIFATASDIEKTETTTTIIMALNKEDIIVNGTEVKTSAPISALNKTYIDLYAMAPFLNIEVKWIDNHIELFKANQDVCIVKYTLASQWTDLVNLEHKFFVKDSKIYVALREITNLLNYNLTYRDGIITIGNTTDLTNDIYTDVSLFNFDHYVLTTYPSLAQHIINPYQAYGYENMISDISKLQTMYPELIKTSSIGKSVEGRDLLLVEFGRGPNKIFVCGTHHAREYICTTYLMYAIDRYAYAYRTESMWGKYNPKSILDNVTFYIVPMVNPDGVNLVQNGVYTTKEPDKIQQLKIYEGSMYGYKAWKANMNGVDLNWNYDKDWSETKNKNPRGSSGFTGDRPGTEPETLAISNYVDSYPFDAYMSFHTQGEVIYWADNQQNPSYINKLIQNDTGFTGYRDNGTGIGGSFFDYVYRNFNKPTITVELCPYIGNYPYPDKDFDRVWNPAKNILLIAGNEITYMKNK